MLVLFSVQFAKAQPPPPPTDPPEGLTYYPFDNPVVLFDAEPIETMRFETINNTPCTAEFFNWFHVGKRNKSTMEVETINTQEIPFILAGGQSGTVTNFQLFTAWGLPDLTGSNYEYIILSTGVYLKFGNMSGYMTLLPNASGTTILVPGNDPPCDCFIFRIVSTGSKITLTLDPCP
jgi:hypothetical protein